MTHAEFVDWLNREVAESRMTTAQKDDLLAQKALFDHNKDMIYKDFRNLIVGYVAGARVDNRDLHALLQEAKSAHPGKMIYFEPIGFDLF